MTNARGFSLLELMITMGAALATMSSLAMVMDIAQQKHQLNADRAIQANDHLIFLNTFEGMVTRSNYRLIAFTGPDPIYEFASSIVPFWNKCVDLTSNCNKNTAILGASTDPNPSTMRYTIICALTPNQWIIDSPGVVPDMKALEVFQVNSEPVGVLYQMTSGAVAFNPGYNPLTGQFANGLFNSNPDCAGNFRTTQQLYAVGAQPYVLPRISNVYPAANTALKGLGQLPSYVTRARLWSFGIDSNTENLELRECTLTQVSAGQIPNCTKVIVQMKGVLSVNFRFMTDALFAPGTTNTFAFNNSTSCVAPSCFNYLPPSNSPYRLGGETEMLLDSNSFSWIKMRKVRRAIVDLERVDLTNNGKLNARGSFEIKFGSE